MTSASGPMTRRWNGPMTSRRGLRRLLAALAVVALLVGACGGSATATPGAPGGSQTGAGSGRSPAPGAVEGAAGPGGNTSTPAAATLPAFSHVYVLVLENHDLAGIIDSGAAPYLRSLADRYALATAYAGVAHPSEPNYLALFSGSTQGIHDDGVHSFDARTLADQLEAAGKDWRVYAQNVPGGCYTGATASGGPDGQGTYARKHNPAISFTGISGNPSRCANIQDFSSFDPAAAPFELIVPNLCNDMHDCSVAHGDAWAASFVPRILTSPAWQQGGVLFITFDEGSGSQPVPTIVVSTGARAGFRSSVPHDHYSLLRTIEDAWHLPCLANACTANTLVEMFR